MYFYNITTLMKLNRNIKIFINYFLGPMLFIWLSWSLYTQIKNQEGLQKAWEQIKRTPLSTVLLNISSVFVLMIFNWLIEAWKWKLVIKKVQALGLFTAFKAVLSGVSFSAVTPNRVGEYAGRVLYLDEGNRLRSVSLTIVCSISQLIITVLMGCLGLLILMNKITGAKIVSEYDISIWLNVFLFGSLAVLVVLLVFYFRLSLFSRLISKLGWMKKNFYLIEELEKTETRLLVKLLLLSLFRFIVFCVQYYLLFRFFHVEINGWQSLWVVSITFLILAAIPLPAFAELPARGKSTWIVMQLFTTNLLGVTITTASIWFVNIIIPAIAGSILIAGIKFFRNKKAEP
jgi:uncharacterized membrane protein YbhN (UPF0104 family)